MMNLDDIIEWDIPNWSKALDFWKTHTAQDLASCNALEIGSKNGGLSLWAAQIGMTVLCTDLNGPSPLAIEKHAHYGVADRISYDALDTLNIPYCDRFNVVMFKSVLPALAGLGDLGIQKKAIGEVHKALKRGGEMWFAENLISSPLHMLLRKKFVPWSQSCRYASINEITQSMSVFSDVRFMTLGFLGAFGRSPLQRTVLGKIDRAFADKLVPNAWHYIIIGVATK